MTRDVLEFKLNFKLNPLNKILVPFGVFFSKISDDPLSFSYRSSPQSQVGII